MRMLLDAARHWSLAVEGVQSMKNMQRAAIVLIASTLSLGIAASSTAFAADAMHGDAMHKSMKKHKAMMKKDLMHKDSMQKEADPAQ